MCIILRMYITLDELKPLSKVPAMPKQSNIKKPQKNATKTRNEDVPSGSAHPPTIPNNKKGFREKITPTQNQCLGIII